MPIEPIIMEPIELPIDLTTIRTGAWDVFREVMATIAAQVPWWVWPMIVVYALVRARTVLLELGKWTTRYLCRSSLLD